MPDPVSAVETTFSWATFSASLSAVGLVVWALQGKLAKQVKEALMAHINSLEQNGKQNEQRLEQKIDMLTSQLKENVQTVGADMKSELGGVRNDLREILVAQATMQASFLNIDKNFLNLEKLLALYVKEEVARQLARAAAQGDH